MSISILDLVKLDGELAIMGRHTVPFDTGAELPEQCRRLGLRISALRLASESARCSEDETRAARRPCATSSASAHHAIPTNLHPAKQSRPSGDLS